MNTLHITNGAYFNAILKTKYNLDGIPFHEAMMTGDTVSKIFSKEFISLRAQTHGVSEAVYREKLAPLLKELKNPDFDEIILWFGKDAFCQMNMLTLLSYLEKQGYHGTVYAQYIDDETGERLGEKTPVSLVGKYELYQKILVEKTFINSKETVLKNAINLYFDYLSDDGFLAKTVRENRSLSKKELVEKLLLCSKDYGLSDLQAIALIEKYGK